MVAPLVAVENGLQGIGVKLKTGPTGGFGSIICSDTVTTFFGTHTVQQSITFCKIK